MIVIFACSIAKPVQMTRTPRSQRRKNSKLLREDGVNRLPRSDTETSPSSQHSASPAAASAAASGVVDKGSSHELEEATRPLKHGGKKKRHSLQPGNHIVDGRGKKRPRSHSKEEVDKDGHEDDPALPASSDKLVASIEAHDRFFSLMLDMIPESFVLPAKQTAESAYSSKYMKNKKGDAPKQSKKEESKQNKRARYAADNQKSIQERQQERAREDARDEADVMDSSIGVGSREEGVFDNGDSKQENGGGAGSEEGLAPEAIRSKTMRVASMDALRKKIQERISEMKKQRTAAEGGRRAKSADKRSAQLMAKRENKRKGAKANKKDKKAANLKGSGSEAARDADTSKNKPKGAASHENGIQAKPEAVGAGPEPVLPPLPSIEDVGDIEFSGLRGVAGGSDRGKRRLPKVGAPGSKMKRLHGLLAAAEEKKKRLASLRQTEEGKERAKEEGWKDAIRLAGGEEVKDNPAALKKMIKRKEKEKMKSAKKWENRMAGQKKEQAKKQEKREENLKKRKAGGLLAAPTSLASGDAAEGVGKRQRRAGFEGKKHDFINKEKPRGNVNGGAGRGGGGNAAGGRGGGKGKGRG